MDLIQIPSGLNEAEVRAVVGKKADIYLRKWQASNRGRFNWAAFLFSGLWLPYRKMYRAAAILYAAIIVESVVEELVFVWWLSMPETPRAIDRGVAIAVCAICGGLGNSWYLEHVRRLAAEARAAIPEESERLAWLTRQGGTNLLAAGGFFALFLFIAIVVFFGLDLIIGQG